MPTRRDLAYKTLLRLCKDAPDDYHYAGVLLAALHTAYQKFEAYQDDAEGKCGEDAREIEEEKRIHAESAYMKQCARLTKTQYELDPRKTETPAAPASTETNNGKPNHKFKLPDIQLPTFDGRCEQWITFRDLFTTAIHDNLTMSQSQKMFYLRSQLSGDASKLISALPVSNDNYLVAWNIINDRYNNPRLLVHAYLERLCDQRALSVESADGIRSLIDVTIECKRALAALKRPVHEWDDWLVFIIQRKLDKDTYRAWIQSRPDNLIPTFDQLKMFLENRAQSIQTMSFQSARHAFSKREGHQAHFTTTQQQTTVKRHSARNAQRPFPSREACPSQAPPVPQSAGPVCPNCTNSHYLFRCENFLALNASQRVKEVTRLGVCSNCLSSRHSKRDCTSRSRCRHCQKSHHTLLHETCPIEPSASDVMSTHLSTGTCTSLLSTVLLDVDDLHGNRHLLRGLLDTGSEANFISERCAQLLRLHRQAHNTQVNGISGINAGQTHGKVSLVIRSRHAAYNYPLECLVLRKLSDCLPKQYINTSSWEFIQNLSLADPKFNDPAPIDVLLGADVFANCLTSGRISNNHPLPTALNTQFGWILLGQVGLDSPTSSTTAMNVSLTNEAANIESLLQRFWEVEDVPNITSWSPSESDCVKQYQQTTYRTASGKYVVKLPFINIQPILGESRQHAVRVLLQLERRFARNKELQQEYVAFMRDYRELGHMEIADTTVALPTYYLPHHAVRKESSTTTKLRVVFNASARTTNNRSLNDEMHPGPALQTDIVDVITRFRRHKIAFTADITKMYRQILVNKEHTSYQRIVWRDSPHQVIQDYNLLTVTYGTNAAPFLAIQTLRQLAEDERDRFPLAYETIIKDMYVDDAITGAASTEDAKLLQGELRDLLKAGGFELRKFASNHQSLLTHLPPALCETRSISTVGQDEQVGALGIRWMYQADTFGLQKPTLESPPLTKRSLLSNIARIYDPLGWFSPVTITLKILLQQLWHDQLKWDDPIPVGVDAKYIKIHDNLDRLLNIQIPRWTRMDESSSIMLHGFSDASERAYAAAVYLRCHDAKGRITITLLAAKTKVAPIKQLTLPRLELCGAVLLAKLMTKLAVALALPDTTPQIAWTDSKIVLAWLNASPSRWHTFVANRVAAIQSRRPLIWRHVTSACNPADLASRGIDVQSLASSSMWWHGPDWMTQPEATWPVHADTSFQTNSESRQPAIVIHATTLQTEDDNDVLSRYSTLDRLITIIGWCQRFQYNCTHKDDRIIGELLVHERKNALFSIIRVCQRIAFHTEIEILRTGSDVQHKSQLRHMQPVLDNRNILRVGGRLRHANLSYDRKSPIILCKSSMLTKLIISHLHVNHLHSGIQSTLSLFLRNYWAPGARRLVRTIVRKCVDCCRRHPTHTLPLMGDLPSVRVNLERPFQRTGVDYAGPITLRLNKGRGHKTTKGFISVFVCLATKAVHLEAVTDLTTDAFLAALRRFCARRGLCQEIYSDNGTNFVGAARKLDSFQQFLYSQAHSERVQRVLSRDAIQWKFIPPRSPHFGGLWEAAVKSVKTHLMAVLHTTTLTYEELTTLLCQIEAILNSRPLTPLSDDPDDFNVLTPGHFLIGQPLLDVPDSPCTTSNTHLSRWQYVQRLKQHFAQRWMREYLPTLQRRSKWTTHTSNLKVGQLVILKDVNTGERWPLGRIEEVHPGSDGVVRVATIRTSKGVLKRPITKLCPVPIEDITSRPAECFIQDENVP